MNVLFNHKLLTVTYSLHLGQTQNSVLTAELINRHFDNDYSSKMGSPLVLTNSPPTSLWPGSQHQVWNSLPRAGRGCEQKSGSYLIITMPLLYLWGLLSWEDLKLKETIADFPPQLPGQQLLALWKLASGKEAAIEGQMGFLFCPSLFAEPEDPWFCEAGWPENLRDFHSLPFHHKADKYTRWLFRWISNLGPHASQTPYQLSLACSGLF